MAVSLSRISARSRLLAEGEKEREREKKSSANLHVNEAQGAR